MTGQKFGKLTVIERLPRYKNNKTFYNCLCECGNEKIVSGSNLITGNVKSCGCISKERKDRRRDYTGQKFGRLTVLEMIYNYQNKNKTYAKCQCDCGNITIASISNIKKGKTKSCGCFEKESRYMRNHTYDLVGKRFNNLVVTKFVGLNKFGHALWECQCDCGNIINVTTGNLTRGHTGSCGCLIKSKMESYIADILTSENINFIEQYTFDDCKNVNLLPFDFYLPDYNVCIEYDGEQHYYPIEYFGGIKSFEYRKNNDKIKNTYCKNNNINLIRFSYLLSKQEIKEKIINIKNPVTTTVL